MKRCGWLALVGLCLVVSVLAGWAQETGGMKCCPMMAGAGPKAGPESGRMPMLGPTCPMMGRGMPQMMGGGMGPMTAGPSMVSTPEGGVIVLSGNTLLKYDKNLNLIKKVEIKPEPGKMQGATGQTQERCPTCGPMCGQMTPKPEKGVPGPEGKKEMH